MLLINCKVELKLCWTKYCDLSALGAAAETTGDLNSIFTIKDTKLNVSVVTLSAKTNQKLLTKS